MADEDRTQGDDNGSEHHSDPETQFIERTAAKYEEADRKREEAEDGGGPTDDTDDTGAGDAGAADAGKGGAKGAVKAEDKKDPKGGKQDDDADDESTDEHTDPDTSADDPDGDAAESGEDSEDDDESDHASDEESEESAEDDDADSDDAEEEEDEEDDAGEESDEFKGAAGKHGIDLTLDDITDPDARKLVQQKIKAMDAGYTRMAQEAREGRKELLEAKAEQRFREQNPDLAIVEFIESALEKDPDFLEKVQARLDKHHEDKDVAAAFKIVLKDKRREAADTLTAELAVVERRANRAESVETLGRKLATSAGLPWRIAEKAIVLGMKKDPTTGEVDISDDEVKAIIADEAKAYNAELRTLKRDKSKALVRDKAKARAGAPAAPAAKARASAGAASPKPGAPKKPAYDDDDEESRQSHMMATANRVLGKKQK